MARKQRSLVGIELGEHEIRLVEISYTASKPVVLGAGFVVTPAHSIRDGLIVQTDAVALAIRRVISMVNATATEAVIGIAAASTVTRTLNLPPAAETELAHLVAGEVQHFQILRSFDAAYDFFPMHGANPSEAGDGMSVLLMGAESPVIEAVRDTAAKAGLEVSALEPTHIGLYRTAYPYLESQSSCMLLLVSETRAEIALTVGGKLALYRRLDVGANTLLVWHVGDDPFLSMPADDSVAPTLREGRVHIGPANTLAIELKRSLEFFAREYPNADPIGQLVVSTTEPALEEILPWLGAELHLEPVLIGPKDPVADSRDAATQLAMPGGVRYAAAYGLALRGADNQSADVPKLDLFVRARSFAEIQEKRKSFAGSLIVSIFAILAGSIAIFLLGSQANRAALNLGEVKEKITTLERQYQRNAERELLISQQIQLLRAEGVPVQALMDTVVNAMDPNVGITDMQIDTDGTINVAGEARSEDDVIRTAANLKLQPLIRTASVANFEKIQGERGGNMGYRFRIYCASATAAPLTASLGGRP